MANGKRGIKEYLKQFQEFHSSFYSSLRSFLITGRFPEDLQESLEIQINTEKGNAKANEGMRHLNDWMNERQIMYKVLLENTIKTFCINHAAPFLADCHSLSFKFFKKNKKKQNKNKPDLPFRGVVFLHSREFGEGKSMAIPFGLWESDKETKVTYDVFNVRHSVSHILGEAMWRFFKPGESKIPCVYFGRNELLEAYPYSFCIDNVTVSDVSDGFRDKLNHLNFVKSKKWHDELYKELNKGNKHIKQIIKRGTNKFNSFLPEDGKLLFLIEGFRFRYSKADIGKLLANPIRQAIISDAKNIFYIPDIHRSSVTGGLVCELSLKAADKTEISKEKLYDVLTDLQWIFSNYVFAAISSCETEFGSGIEFTYSEQFFTSNVSKTSKKVFEDFKNDLYVKLEQNDKLKETLDPLRYFFEAVSEERGQYVRGYEDISKKAFITICKLWNALEVYKIAGGKKIGTGDLEKVETDVKNFKNISEGVDAIQLLWVALDFEDMLKNVPSYREHFIHSFHVFCLGLWILSHTKFPYHQHLKEEHWLSQWFLTALWHDVSYAMQKLAEISNILIKELVRHGYERKKKELLVPISPSWGHLLLAEDFYKLLVGHTNFQKVLKETLTGTPGSIIKDVPNVLLERALNNAEHGILSGLVLYHQLRNASGSNRAKWKKILPIIVAIMLHGCYDWKWKDKNRNKINGAKNLKVDVNKAPIAHLLMLCDTFVHSGREFYDEKTDSATQQEIRFREITSNSVDSENIRIVLEYSNIDQDKLVEKIKELYFDKPKKVLNEKNSSNVDKNIMCNIENKDDSDDKLAAPISFTFA